MWRKYLTLAIGVLLMSSLSACGGGGGGGSSASTDDVTGGTGTTDTTDTSQYIVASQALPGNGYGIALIGSHAFIAAATEGLQVVDVADGANPSIVGENTNVFGGGGVVTTSAYSSRTGIYSSVSLLVSGDLAGLHFFDIDEPSSPSLVASNFDGRVRDVAASDAVPFWCAADRQQGIRVYVDNSVTHIETPKEVEGVAAQGNYCFATGLGPGPSVDAHFYVIRIEAESDPALVSTLTLDNAARVAVAGDYAYVTAGNPGMYVIDVSDPANPAVVGETGPLPVTQGIAIDTSRMRAYLGTTDTDSSPNDGLKVVDISSPSAPAVIATVDLPDWTGDLTAQDGFVYAVTAKFEGPASGTLQIVDVSTF